MEPSLLWLATLILKLTILATGAWLADFSLRTVNPRWRVGLWRVALLAACGLVAAAFVPPLYRWEIVRTTNVEPRPVVAAANPSSERGEGSSEQDSEARPVNEMSTEGSPAPIVDMAEADRLPFDDPSSASSARHPTEPSSVPEAEPSLDIRPRFYWSQLAILIWVGGAAVGLARLALGVIRVRRIVARSEVVSDDTLAAARRLAERLRVALPEVLSSSDVTSPVLYDPVRPTILLPRAMVEETSNAEREAALAHELAHVAGRDAWWDLAMRLAVCLAWPHPLAWRAPSAHRQACDRVSDLVAAEALGDRGNYGRSLAQIALRVTETPPGTGLAMARRADVVERVRLIASDVRAAALGKRGWLASACIAVIVISMGGFAVALTSRTVVAQEPALTPDLEVTILASENGAPLADAEVQLIVTPEPYDKATISNVSRKTDAAGLARFDYPTSEAATLTIVARQKGFVPYYVSIERQPRAAFLKTKTVRMERGDPIGGQLVDDQDMPFSNVKFTVRAPATETVNQFLVFSLLEGTTDESGRWRLDAAPKSLSRVSISPNLPGHPRYSLDVRAGIDEKYVIPRGWTLRGNVRNADGEPIADVPFTAGGGSPYLKSDADGKFECFGLSRNRAAVLTFATNTTAPQRFEVLPPEEGDAALDVVLEPGKTMRVRVLDAAGEAIEGAKVRTWKWRGDSFDFWTGSTDADGLAEWHGAPTDEVRFYIGAPGFIGKDEFPLIAGGDVHEVHLAKQFSVSGTVVDDAIGEPIPEFKATIRQQLGEGSPPRWFDDNPSVGLAGQFALTRNREAPALSLKIEAEGYAMWTSEAMPSTGAQPPFEVRLKKALPEPASDMRTLAGIVSDADGKPVAGAQILLGLDSERQRLLELRGVRYSGFRGTSDADGRFEIEYPSIPDEGGRLSVQHDVGYAEAPLLDFLASGSIRLQPWARIEVNFQRGSNPAPFRGVSYSGEPDRDNFVGFGTQHVSGRTDANGLAVLERIPPGAGRVSVDLTRSLSGGAGLRYAERSERVTLAPGETKRVQLGGTGRTIVGRIELPPDPPMPHGWASNEAGTLEIAGEAPLSPDRRIYRFLVDEEGKFRVDDVPAGTYQIELTLFGLTDERSSLRGKAIGKVVVGPFDHREDDAAPHDLGVIQGEWNDRLGAGDVAPAFVAQTADGGTSTLADYRGKLLLLNFWNSREAESMQSMSEIAKLRESFAMDDRFGVVSVAVDSLFASAVETAKKNGWTWTIAKGDTEGLFGRTYDLYATPDCLLIGSEGRILHRGRDATALRTAIDVALKQMPPASAQRSEGVSAFVEVDDSGFLPTVDVASIVVFGKTHASIEEQDTRQAASGTFLFGDDGTLIRRVESDANPQTNTRSGLMAFDARRGRAYVHEEYGRLMAYDRRGSRLHGLHVPNLSAVAVDGSNGDVWCLCRWNRDEGWTLVFDAQGRPKGGYPISGTEARFSPAADAFWFGASSARLIDRNGVVLVEHKLDEQYAYLRFLTIDANGNCWAFEQPGGRSDARPRRVWRYTKDGAEEATSFAYDPTTKQGVRFRWMEAVGDEVWIGYEDAKGESPWGYGIGHVRRFALDGQLLGELDLDLRAASSVRDGLWGVTKDELIKVDAAGNVTESYPNQNRLPGRQYQGLWVESFPGPQP